MKNAHIKPMLKISELVMAIQMPSKTKEFERDHRNDVEKLLKF